MLAEIHKLTLIHDNPPLLAIASVNILGAAVRVHGIKVVASDHGDVSVQFPTYGKRGSEWKRVVSFTPDLLPLVVDCVKEAYREVRGVPSLRDVNRMINDARMQNMLTAHRAIVEDQEQRDKEPGE